MGDVMAVGRGQSSAGFPWGEVRVFTQKARVQISIWRAVPEIRFDFVNAGLGRRRRIEAGCSGASCFRSSEIR
jgi:hypothetical protein